MYIKRSVEISNVDCNVHYPKNNETSVGGGSVGKTITEHAPALSGGGGNTTKKRYETGETVKTKGNDEGRKPDVLDSTEGRTNGQLIIVKTGRSPLKNIFDKAAFPKILISNSDNMRTTLSVAATNGAFFCFRTEYDESMPEAN